MNDNGCLFNVNDLMHIWTVITHLHILLHLRSCVGVPVIRNKVKEVVGATIAVSWEPPLEGACPVISYNVYYREVISQAARSKWNTVTVSRTTTSYTLYLNCWKEYEIAVTSLNAYKESNFHDSNTWKLRTRGGN